MKKLALYATLGLLPLSLSCSEETAYLHLDSYPQKDEKIVDHLKGIYLISDSAQFRKKYDDARSCVHISNVTIPGNDEELKAILNCHYLKKSLTQFSLIELKKEIIQFYKRNGMPVVNVIVPEQDVSSGILTLVIIVGEFDGVTVSGNRHFSSGSIKSMMRHKKGKPLDEKQLLNDLALLNQNPYRSVNATLVPGKTRGKTDVHLDVKDRMPITAYIGADNTGSGETVEERVFGGFRLGNLFGMGHLLSYQFTASSNFGPFQAHTGEYVMPLPWHHTLKIYGGYSKVKPYIQNFKSKGKSYQISTRYRIPTTPLYTQQKAALSFGFDFKHSNNNLAFIAEDEIPIISKNVNLSQIAVGYDYINQHEKGVFSADVNLFYSPAQIFKNQSDSALSCLRKGAQNTYIYGRFDLTSMTQLKSDFSLLMRGRAQLASNALLPSEQCSIGGENSVRGYHERVYNFDDAINANLELHTPHYPLLGKYNTSRLYGLMFVDFGAGWDIKKTCPQAQNGWLLSTGPGLRFEIADHFTAKLDLGFKLHRVRFGGANNHKLHFSVVSSY